VHLLGKEKTLARIDRALAQAREGGPEAVSERLSAP
jgi:hypothetical protein